LPTYRKERTTDERETLIKRRHMNNPTYPYRKFAFAKGTLEVGRLISREQEEDYFHYDLTAAAIGTSTPSQAAMGWIIGTCGVLSCRFSLVPSEPTLANAKQALTDWAGDHGVMLRFETTGGISTRRA
jgi:hypothetical protein